MKKKKLKPIVLVILVMVFSLIVGGSVGYFAGSNTKKIVRVGTIYDEVVSIIKNQFFDYTESTKTMDERMLSGLTHGLGDDYTYYLEKKDNEDLRTSINGVFDGLGISYSAIYKGALINEVFKNGPAEKAGLKAGDIIVLANGKELSGKKVTEMKEIILSKKNVSLVYYSNGKKINKTIETAHVSSAVYYEIRNHLGYIRITTFGSSTAKEVEKAFKLFKSKQIDAICLDLRGNTGGYTIAAQELLNLLVPKDCVIYKTQSKQGIEEYKASDCTKYRFNQGFVLVNRDTASAAEIVTAGVSDILNYQIVGETTFGKGIVQSLITLSDGSTLRVTTSKWLTSEGVCVQGKGIKPHYEVKKESFYDYSFNTIKSSIKYDTVSSTTLFLQKALKSIGYPIDRNDGYFSRSTETCLKSFESKYGLKVDGVLDENDQTILMSVLYSNIKDPSKDYAYMKVQELVK